MGKKCITKKEVKDSISEYINEKVLIGFYICLVLFSTWVIYTKGYDSARYQYDTVLHRLP